jgi:hypothetical protein
VLGAKVFMARTSSWVVGCSSGSLGLLVSAAPGRGTTDVYGWVVGVVVWIVSRT